MTDDKSSNRPPKTEAQHAFSDFAAAWQRTAYEHPEDSDGMELVQIQWALESAYRDGDHRWLGHIGGQARAYLKEHNRGPRPRPVEANALCNWMQIDLDALLSERELAQRFCHRLRCLPELCSKTRLPIAHVAYADAARERDIEAVQQAFTRLKASAEKDAERWTIAGLKALDHASAKNVFAHRK